MKRITGFKGILAMGVLIAMLASIPVSAAELDHNDPVFEDTLQEPGDMEDMTDTIGTDDVMIENPGQDGEGESFLPSEDVLDQVETKRQGSIGIQLAEGKTGTTVRGITFYCIQVADIIGGEYVLLEEYDQSGIDLNEIENSVQLNAAALSLAEIVSGGKSETTDSQGCAVFEDLEVGVYLIKAEDNESYDMIAPTLLAIPTWDEDAGDMQYDIAVVPKHTPRPDTPVTVNTAPQTNLKDDTLLYLAAGSGCLLLVVILVLAGRKKGFRK